MSATVQTYSSKSAAIRGASRNGLTLDQINLTQTDGRWSYEAKVEAVALPTEVLLAYEDGDFGLCVGGEAKDMAQRLANEEQVTIYLRDPLTDEVLDTIQPEGSDPVVAEVEGDVAEQHERDTFVPAPEQHDDHVIAFRNRKEAAAAIGEVEPQAEAPIEAKTKAEPVAAPQVEREVIPMGDWMTAGRTFTISIEGDSFPQSSPQAWAIEFAKRIRRPVVVRDAVTNEALWSYDPTKAKAQAKVAKAERAAAPKADRPAKAPKTAPDGKYATIVALCCREEGASPDELFQATQWHKAPWKWLLSNPKGNGLCERFGYTLEVRTSGGGKHKATRYCLTKNAPAEQLAEAA